VAAVSHDLGPDTAELRILTRREGLAARAGHDLVLVVTSWRATLALEPGGALELTADGGSLEVRSGSGGVKPLSDRDRRDILRNVDAKVLRGAAIAYRATLTERGDAQLRFEGRLRIGDAEQPADVTVELAGGGRFHARHELRQTAFAIKPYSGLMGTLKLADEVAVEVEGVLT
jgi:hypothetical protein